MPLFKKKKKEEEVIDKIDWENDDDEVEQVEEVEGQDEEEEEEEVTPKPRPKIMKKRRITADPEPTVQSPEISATEMFDTIEGNINRLSRGLDEQMRSILYLRRYYGV